MDKKIVLMVHAGHVGRIGLSGLDIARVHIDEADGMDVEKYKNLIKDMRNREDTVFTIINSIEKLETLALEIGVTSEEMLHYARGLARLRDLERPTKEEVFHISALPIFPEGITVSNSVKPHTIRKGGTKNKKNWRY